MWGGSRVASRADSPEEIKQRADGVAELLRGLGPGFERDGQILAFQEGLPERIGGGRDLALVRLPWIRRSPRQRRRLDRSRRASLVGRERDGRGGAVGRIR